jgi:hypothetical protein
MARDVFEGQADPSTVPAVNRRLRGELQLKREDNDAAVADLREAIGVARRNRSKTL